MRIARRFAWCLLALLAIIKLRAKDGGVFAGSYRIAKDRVTLIAGNGARVELQRVY